MLIRLSDAELDAVFLAARPLAVRDRDAFLQHVADQLSTCTEIGPGTVAKFGEHRWDVERDRAPLVIAH